jgi:hypothetical protein
MQMNIQLPSEAEILNLVERRSYELQAAIAKRAYFGFEQRGGAAGDAVSDWLSAEAEVLSSQRYKYMLALSADIDFTALTAPRISAESLIDHLKRKLLEAFPREEFLHAEIDGILQAIVNYIHSAVLAFAEKPAHRYGGIGGILTVNHFVMSDSEVAVADLLNEIVFTSGLTYSAAYYGLQEINEELDQRINGSSLVLLRQVNVMSFCRQAGQRPNRRISTICRLRRASGKVGTEVFFKAPALEQQEGIGQAHQGDMMMPALPAAALVGLNVAKTEISAR